MAARGFLSVALPDTRAPDDQHSAFEQHAPPSQQSERPFARHRIPNLERYTFESLVVIAAPPTTTQCSRQSKLLPYGCVTVHAPISHVGQTRLNLLADIDAIHEVVPSGRLRQASNQLYGFRLNAFTFRDSSRHDVERGMAKNDGKRPFWRKSRMTKRRERLRSTELRKEGMVDLVGCDWLQPERQVLKHVHELLSVDELDWRDSVLGRLSS